MNKKTLALSGLALSSMMALGCGSPNNTDAGMGGSDTPVPTMEPVSRTYIVGAITNEMGLDSSMIGAITLWDRHSIVEVPEQLADAIIATLNSTKIKGKKLQVRRDRAFG